MCRSLAEQAAEALDQALAETHPVERVRLMDAALRLRRLAAAEARSRREEGGERPDGGVSEPAGDG